MRILISFILLCLFGFSLQGSETPLVKYYIRIDGFRHATRHELILKSKLKFKLEEKNFKGDWLTEGTWSVSGDTLILAATTKTKKGGLRYKKKDKNEFILTKKYFIVSGGLKEIKTSDKFTYYSKKEWKKLGKPSDVWN